MDFSGWTDEDPRVILAVVLGFVAVIVVYKLRRNKYKKLERIKAECIENKTVIHANCLGVKCSRDSDGELEEYGTYEYEFEGKMRKYSVSSKRGGVPYVQIHLYYGDGVREPFSDHDITAVARTALSLGILAGIATVLLTMHFTGYITIPFLERLHI